jgi:hypothetical protein
MVAGKAVIGESPRSKASIVEGYGIIPGFDACWPLARRLDGGTIPQPLDPHRAPGRPRPGALINPVEVHVHRRNADAYTSTVS